MHLACTETNTISKWTKTRFHMTHFTLVFHRVRPKWFLRLGYVRHKPCNYLASRLALYQMNGIKHILELRHLGVLSGASKIIFWAYGVFSTNRAPTMNRHQHYLQMDQNETPHDPRLLRVPSGVSKIISKAVVHSAQTVHLSWVKISTIFERTKLSFHFRLVT
jgi:hypothetical protein